MKQNSPIKGKNVLFILILGVVTAAFTGVWLAFYNWLNVLIWSNNYVQTHRYLLSLGVIIFSLLIGLCQKYLRAPNMIHGGSLTETFTGGDKKVDLKTFPGALIISYLSILSGA